MMPRYEDHAEHASHIFRAALKAADPAEALRACWGKAWGRRATELDEQPPILILAIGKSSLEMARACLELLPHPAETTLVTAVPERIGQTSLPTDRGGRIRIMP